MKNPPDPSDTVSVVPELFRKWALELLWSHLNPATREQLLASITAESETYSGDYWAGLVGHEALGVAWAQFHRGNVASIHGPRVVSADPVADRRLLDAASAQASRQGIKIIQALKEVDDICGIGALAVGGFEHVADLLYMVCDESAFPTRSPVSPLRFESFSPEAEPRLRKMIEATYQGSLDCPAVDGVRTVDEVLEGYRATGVFDPARWLLVSASGGSQLSAQDIGCLLLADHPQQDQFELIYMGVCPEARGWGYGVEIVRQAQWMAHQAHRRRLVLAVDAANDPGVRMYAAAGFQSFARKALLIHVLNRGD